MQSARKGKGGSSAAAKPAWALSSAEAEEAAAAEEAELLSFAEGLDFDSFINQLDDMEVADALQVGRFQQLYVYEEGLDMWSMVSGYVWTTWKWPMHCRWGASLFPNMVSQRVACCAGGRP